MRSWMTLTLGLGCTSLKRVSKFYTVIQVRLRNNELSTLLSNQLQTHLGMGLNKHIDALLDGPVVGMGVVIYKLLLSF